MNETAAKPLAKASPKSHIRDLLQSDEFRTQIARALPRAMSGNAARFARVALTATFKQPKLLDCTQQSLFNCLLRLSELGLEPDGRRAHLIPYKDECTLILDYKGIAELIRRNGDVAYIHCDVVCERDHFDYRFGTHGKLEHIPATGDRGPVLKAYSFIRLRDGTEEYDVMSTEDIERVRKRSRAANDGPWVTDWNEMAKKTVFRRHAKLLPLSPEIREMIESDDEPLTETERFNAAKPVSASVATPPAAPKRGRPSKNQELPEASQASTESLFGQQQMPQESVSTPSQDLDAPEEQTGSETVLERIQGLLKDNGFTEEHLIELLRRVRIMDKEKSLDQLPLSKLSAILDDWANCQARLEEVVAGK
jgi:recombination protein RecT